MEDEDHEEEEGGKRVPIANNLEAMKRALEDAGMKFGENTLEGPIKQ